MSAQETRVATLRGRISADTSMRPIADAEVYLPTLQRSVRTDAKGGFRIDSIPPGRQRVRARKVGYAAYDAAIDFKPGETEERAIILPRVQPLDTVTVVGEANLPLSFLDHRALGLGSFLTRVELEKLAARPLYQGLVQVRGVDFAYGRSGQAWIMSKRAPATIRSIQRVGRPNEPGETMYTPDAGERNRGMKPGCYARVYLDRQLLNPTTPAEPVDINQFPAEMLEAVEFFAGPASTPLEYAKLNSDCGVLVLHRRR